MHFGKAEHTGPVDYSLNEDHKSLARVLGGIKNPVPKVYVGGVLWADEQFKGLIYPKNAKPAEYVKYYTRQFNTIELNSTHYRVPGPEAFVRWRETAPVGFKFCPKINQAVSHAGNLKAMIGFHNECNRLFEILGDRLGPCFMQLPPHFSTDRLNELLEFLDNSELQNISIELRHESWFRNEKELNLLCNFLYKNKMGLVITDTAGRRDVVHMRLSNKTAIIRFKAANEKELDEKRMTDWIEKAKSWFEAGLEEFYFFIHTADKADMPFLALYFIEQLEKICGVALNPPVLDANDAGALF